MEIIKKNITLILGISIPILMILFVAGSIYLPGLFIKPHFNFLYVALMIPIITTITVINILFKMTSW